jgi:DNA-binding response OmpR family regulator
MENILIVEDDVHINNMLCDLLKLNDYASHSAFSGTEALLLLSQEVL